MLLDRRQSTGIHGTSAFPHEGSAGSLTGGGSLTRRTGSVSPTRSVAATSPTQSWHAGAVSSPPSQSWLKHNNSLLFQWCSTHLVDRHTSVHCEFMVSSVIAHMMTAIYKVWPVAQPSQKLRRLDKS